MVAIYIIFSPLIKKLQAQSILSKVHINNVQLAMASDKKQAQSIAGAAKLWESKEDRIYNGLARCFYYEKKGKSVKCTYSKVDKSSTFDYEYDSMWLEEYKINKSGTYILYYNMLNPIVDLKIGFKIYDKNGDILFVGIENANVCGEITELQLSASDKVNVAFIYLFNEDIYNEFIADTNIKYSKNEMTYPMNGKMEIAEVFGLIIK